VRHIFGVFTALVTAVLIIIMAQMIREGLYPLPPNLDIDDTKTLIQWISSLPDQAFVIIAISHSIAAFAAGLISSLVVGRSRMSTGIITMSSVFLLVMVYLFTYNFPTWFVITDTIATAILGFVGAVTGSGRVND
jgi:hypothetical protein